MSPVELLRAAAAKVRERADNASAGPWRALADPQDGGYPLTAVGVWSAEEAFVFECHDTMRVDAKWIALMHPGVAEHLAALLELQAERGPTFAATELARVLLGVPNDAR